MIDEKKLNPFHDNSQCYTVLGKSSQCKTEGSQGCCLGVHLPSGCGVSSQQIERDNSTSLCWWCPDTAVTILEWSPSPQLVLCSMCNVGHTPHTNWTDIRRSIRSCFWYFWCHMCTQNSDTKLAVWYKSYKHVQRLRTERVNIPLLLVCAWGRLILSGGYEMVKHLYFHMHKSQ